jgi:acyl carrier protein
VAAAICEVVGRDVEFADSDVLADVFDLDQLQILEIFAFLEDHGCSEFPLALIDSIQTIDDLNYFVKQKLE